MSSKSAPPATRDHALQHLALELGRAHDDNSYRFSILMVEFEGLSRRTDHLGDTSVNDMLPMVMGVLKADLGAQDLCCRLGGDDFLLIFSAKGAPECQDLVERLGRRWSLEAAMCPADIDVSVGFASSTQGSTIEGLFAAADEAMRPVTSEPIILSHGPVGIASAARATRPAAIGFPGNRVDAFAAA